MSTEACQAPCQIRTIAPLPAGFQRTPEWHRARAQLLRWLNDPSTRWLARQHLNLAKRPLPNAGQNVDGDRYSVSANEFAGALPFFAQRFLERKCQPLDGHTCCAPSCVQRVLGGEPQSFVRLACDTHWPF